MAQSSAVAGSSREVAAGRCHILVFRTAEARVLELPSCKTLKSLLDAQISRYPRPREADRGSSASTKRGGHGGRSEARDPKTQSPRDSLRAKDFTGEFIRG